MRHASGGLALSLAILASLGCGTSKREAERELAVASRVSEQLTSEFADSVTEANVPARTFINAPPTALAVEDSIEQGGVRQAVVATQTGLQRVNAVPACPAPAVDASDYHPMTLDPLPISITAPSHYTLRQRQTRVVGRDTITAIVESGGDHLWFSRYASDFPYHDMPEWIVVSHCDDMVSGMHVHFDSAIKRGSGYQRGVSASYHLPTGAYLVVHADFHDEQSERAALYVLRTVQFRSVWSP